MTTSTIDTEMQLGELVEENPAFAQVFDAVGLDYCCGGNRPLETACAGVDLDVSDVCSQLADVRDRNEGAGIDWATLSDLTDHIVTTHHRYLYDELPALEALARKVRRVHGDAHPELRDVERTVLDLAGGLRVHTAEEETDVFPVIEKLDRGVPLARDEAESLRAELRDLEDDHEATATLLERIADLTDDYTVPDDACTSYRNLYDRLSGLERDTHMHVHRENNVLFPAVEEELSSPDG